MDFSNITKIFEFSSNPIYWKNLSKTEKGSRQQIRSLLFIKKTNPGRLMGKRKSTNPQPQTRVPGVYVYMAIMYIIIWHFTD